MDMPRESVRGSHYKFVALEEGEDGSTPWSEDNRLGALEIGWAKYPNGHVEVATCDESLLKGEHGLFNQVAKAVNEGADVEVVVRDFFAPSAGLWVAMDRDGCNLAIRRLREARDGAFGKDM